MREGTLLGRNTVMAIIYFLAIHQLHSTPLLGGSRRNIAMPFGMEKKLEWCGYPVVKNFEDYVYSF